MSWLRSQIADVTSSVAAAAEDWQPDIILANQLAYGQVKMTVSLQLMVHLCKQHADCMLVTHVETSIAGSYHSKVCCSKHWAAECIASSPSLIANALCQRRKVHSLDHAAAASCICGTMLCACSLASRKSAQPPKCAESAFAVTAAAAAGARS
jgi:hypothetical protein